MVERFQKELKSIQKKLEVIGFYKKYDENFIAIFKDDSNWNIIFECDRYSDVWWIWLKNNENEFSITHLMVNVFHIDYLTIENVLDFLIENKDKIFDETFPYKEAYDKLK